MSLDLAIGVVWALATAGVFFVCVLEALLRGQDKERDDGPH